MEKVIRLDEDNENWLPTVRLQRLRERGWKGTLEEYFDQYETTGKDPLDEPDESSDGA
jgi:hypothetical protein